MKSIKLVILAGIAILMCAITAATKQVNNNVVKHITINVQQDSATKAACIDQFGCSMCIPINQPY